MKLILIPKDNTKSKEKELKQIIKEAKLMLKLIKSRQHKGFKWLK